MSIDILVVGSLNMDLIFHVNRRPSAGETITSESFQSCPGGKGCNQAIAAARSGGSTAMIGRLGSDSFATSLIEALEASGVDHSYIILDDKFATGLASIYIDATGDNSIVVAPGANGELSVEDVENSSELIQRASTVLMQLEIPMASVLESARIARALGKRVILNPAPAPCDDEFTRELLEKADVLVVNESEAVTLTTRPLTDESSIFDAAERLFKMCGSKSDILITCGVDGVRGVDRSGGRFSQQSFEVDCKDTTGAGDAFCGTLATSLTRGDSLKKAVLRASAAGALATTKIGATNSLPAAEEIERFLESRA